MTTIILPHRDPGKAGATEHVDAILQALQADKAGITIAEPVLSKYEQQDGKNLPLDLTAQLESVKRLHGDARYVVVTGDYGADPALHDTSVAAGFKRVLGADTAVVLSSFTMENKDIVAAFKAAAINLLAVPAHAVLPEVLQGTLTAELIATNRDRLIAMTAVPHMLTRDSLAAKRVEWDQAAEVGKIGALPPVDQTTALVGIVIPGDVEDADGRPKLFTATDAVRLADAVAERAEKLAPGKPLRYMVSNGPRTAKYNEALFDTPDFNANNPAFHNAARMDGVDSNPVARAFIDRLAEYAGRENIVSGCIAKGKVPPQGFLAFYDVLNAQAAAGGSAMLMIDGVSTTMQAQAVNVVDARVRVISCDTPAKNKTHEAGAEDLFAKGHVDQLYLYQLSDKGEPRYGFRPNPTPRNEAKPFDDAAIVAARLRDLAAEPVALRPAVRTKSGRQHKPKP